MAWLWVVLVCLLVVFSPGDAADEPRQNHTVRLLVLLPRTPPGAYKFPFGTEMAGSAVLYAFDEIRSAGLLPDYHLEVDFGNSACNAVSAIGTAYEMFHARAYNAIIGPQCSGTCRVVARLAAYLNVPCFTGVCQDVEMLNKQEFKTLTRFLGTFEMTGMAVARLMEKFGWSRAGLLAEKRPDAIWLLTKLGIEYALESGNISLPQSILLTPGADLEESLVSIAAVSRVIIVAVPGDTFREVLRLAIKHGYTDGEYIFICVDFYKQRRLFGDFHWKQGKEDDDLIKTAYSAVFFISYYVRDESPKYVDFISFVKRQSAESFGYVYEDEEEVPYPAANLFEAVYLLGVALNETLAEGGDIRDGRLLSQRLWGRSFPSLTGGVTLNDNGDRDQAYMVRHQQNMDTGRVQVIGNYYSSNGSLTIFPKVITWPGKRESAPPDTPPCGFDSEICAEDEYSRMMRLIAIFVAVLSGVVFLTSGIVIFVYRKMKWARDLADMRWKIDSSQLNLDKLAVGASRPSQSVVGVNVMSEKSTENGAKGQRFASTLIYKGCIVAAKILDHLGGGVDLSDRQLLEKMKTIHDLSHPNLAKFIGAVVEPPKVILLTEYCMKGSLQGMLYLHGGSLKSHGNLKSSNCVVDGRFVVKLSDFGMFKWHNGPEQKAKDFLWMPPENLVMTESGEVVCTSPTSSQGDIYSFGIVFHEVIYREGAFYRSDCVIEADDILVGVCSKRTPPLRPDVQPGEAPIEITELLVSCWHDQPELRPGLAQIKSRIKGSSGLSGSSAGIMDNLLNRMEQYANNLEELVEERTDKYLEEKKRVEDLLHRLLPPIVADELQTKGHVAPQTFECVTIYFSDIVQFTALCSESSPLQVVAMLNDLYTLFDTIIANFDVYKVETIGDAYMVVSGLPNRNGDQHVVEIAGMSLALIADLSRFKVRHRPDQSLQLRIGIHSGTCVAGVVGLTMPRYCLFGDTVNTASRMESSGEALKIHISFSTYEMLTKQQGFQMQYRGEVPVKGKGIMKTYWLDGRKRDSLSSCT